jgi:thiamine-phosphate pyrophosphorylase
MDLKLLAWGQAVKRRRGARLPVLWLFTDSKRLADPLAAVAELPKGLCGVVLRHKKPGKRAKRARQLAKLCKARRLTLVISGDPRLAAACKAGVHLSRGRWPGVLRCGGRLLTSSAHNAAELLRARRQGAAMVFLSPAFATASHPGQNGLGAAKWSRLAGPKGAYALGGVNGQTIKNLGRRAHGAGAISALGKNK